MKIILAGACFILGLMAWAINGQNKEMARLMEKQSATIAMQQEQLQRDERIMSAAFYQLTIQRP